MTNYTFERTNRGDASPASRLTNQRQQAGSLSPRAGVFDEIPEGSCCQEQPLTRPTPCISVHTGRDFDDDFRRRVLAWFDRRSPGTAAVGDAGTCGEGGELDPRWLNVLRESMGHRPYALIARRNGPDGDICGYLPLALVTGRLFGRFLVGLPYLNRGGLVADDADTAGALIEQAVALGEKFNVQYVELRHSAAVEHSALPKRRCEKMRMVMELPGSGETLWQALSAKVRNQIRTNLPSGGALRRC